MVSLSAGFRFHNAMSACPAALKHSMSADTATYLDLRGLKCPLPVLRTQKLLNRLGPGERVTVECTDPLSVIDIPHMVRTRGDALEHHFERDGVYVFQIRRRDKAVDG